ncbi:MAG: DNA polymerase/3'-5' exonuclease PolX [Chloroflexi bacterium]|nr:DNA polymerase/3'-5' exonuclease PolX [Chloroflexota bacterium]
MPRDPDPPLGSPTNGDLARIFHEIGDLLELKGELVFKTVAYHRAADALDHSPVDVAGGYRRGTPPRIAGVGSAIGDKIAEIVATGRLRFLDRLRDEVPPTLVELLRLPGLGPRTVRLIHESLGIATLDELRAAAEAGRLRTIRGLSAKTEETILAGIAGLSRRSDRMLLGEAAEIVRRLVGELEAAPGVRSVEPAGSFRRCRETIGDLDLLAETTEAAALVERFATLGSVERILNRGSYKAAIRLLDGPQVDLMIMPPGEAGTYRIHFTGSRDHNIRLRERARDLGWSLSEKGFLRLGADGEAASGEDAALRTFGTEAEAYAFLGLPFIEPELREDDGEIEAALAGRLPVLIRLADLRGDLHSHSDWSDGVHPIEAMAEAARRRGHAYQVLADHSRSLAIAHGLTPERVAMERRVIAELNARFEREETEGRLPEGASPDGFRLLHGCELEIRADGRLDYDDELLATFDLVVASLHVARRQSRAELTARVIGAISSPHVDVIAHPAGRMLEGRDDLDLDCEAVFAAAAATGTALEMNGSDHRLDLSAERARLAVAAGCFIAIDSDAHRIEELGFLRWGVGQARRAWVEPSSVVNTRSRADLLAWAAGKPERVRRRPSRTIATDGSATPPPA